MEDAEYCLENFADVRSSKLEIKAFEKIPTMEGEPRRYLSVEKKIDIDLKLLEIFLGNIRDYEKANLDELNNLAVQEAQAEAQT